MDPIGRGRTYYICEGMDEMLCQKSDHPYPIKRVIDFSLLLHASFFAFQLVPPLKDTIYEKGAPSSHS